MASLQALKQRLKSWESEFCETHGHKPGREDIASSPQDIQDTYRDYAKLKKKSQSNQQKVDVWGVELHKKNSSEESKSGDLEDQNGKKKTSVLSRIGQKLLERSNLQLSANKKSLDKTRTPAYASFRKSTSEPNAEDQQDFLDSFSTSNSQSEDKLLPLSEDRTNISQSEKEEPKKNKIFEMATQWSKQKKNTSYSNRHIDASKIESFLDGMPSSLAIQKSKIKTRNFNMIKPDVSQDCSVGNHDSNSQNKNVSQESSNLDNPRNSINDSYDQMLEEVHIPPKLRDSAPTNFTGIGSSPFGQSKPSRAVSEPKSIFQNMNISIPAFGYDHDENDVEGSDHSYKKPDLDLPKSGSLSQRLSQSEASCGVYNFNDSDTSKSLKEGPEKVLEGGQTRRGRKRKNQKETHEEEDEEPSQQSDVGWGNDEQTEMNEFLKSTGSLPEGQESEESCLPQPKKRKTTRSAPISNDNFVRLNMKVKTYRRKGGGMTGGKWKRMQWKQKMNARSQSFGSGKCFKCGQEGHWARNCKGAKQKEKIDSAPWDEGMEKPSVDEASFPTMREAAQKAQGVKPTKQETDSRKTKVKKPKKEKQEESVQDDPDDDDDEDEYPDVVRSSFIPAHVPMATEPLFSLDEDGNIPTTPPEVYEALKKFGHSGFRAGQEQAVMRILCGQSTLVVLSTGAGKSLCYQLPAFMYKQQSNAITLVISPLVSLMEDQVMGLPACVRGMCLHSGMTTTQRTKVMDALKTGDLDFLLISPETLVGSNSGSIKGIDKLPPIAFACIDEAHCVSEWSHHFRPTYLRVCKVLKERFGVRTMLGLTATATMVTAASVSQHLGIADYRRATIRGAPVPPNLYLSVSRDSNRDDALISLLQGDRFSTLNSIIVYCTRRDQTERLATLIRTCLKDQPAASSYSEEKLQEETKKGKGKSKAKTGRKQKGVKSAWDSESYHAGMTSAKRRRVQNAFMSGQLRVVVATVAFGMGLDKSDVRGIIHYNFPKSFESYVQEIGRAGRDGLPAHCHLFLDEEGQDMSELKRHIHGNTVDRFVIKKLVRKVFKKCRCQKLEDQVNNEDKSSDSAENSGVKNTLSSDPVSPCARKKDVCPGHERAIPIDKTVQELDIREEGISTLLCYLELNQRRWIENLTPVYSTCNLNCYGGPQQLLAVAKKCPPVAVAIAMEKKRGISHIHASQVEFPIVDISDTMGWDSGPVKRELKQLMWEFDDTGKPHKSGVMVEFSHLSFRLRSPGNLTDEEIDEVVDFLTSRVTTQEKAELYQLQNFYDTLRNIAHKNHWMCSDRVDENRSGRLKEKISEYFDQQPCFEEGQVTMLSFARELDLTNPSVLDDMETIEDKSYVIGNIRAFINMYQHEHQLSGRAIARVFHGIASPCFPPEVWGRVRRFWRSQLNTDFNQLRILATRELIHMK